MDASSGQLITKAALDYETKSTYRVIVWIHDGKDSNGAENNGTDASQDVTIILTNVGEAGEITLSPDQPHIGTQLLAIVEDLDGSVSGEVWRWARSADMSDWSAIAEAISASYTPVEADQRQLPASDRLLQRRSWLRQERQHRVRLHRGGEHRSQVSPAGTQ